MTHLSSRAVRTLVSLAVTVGLLVAVVPMMSGVAWSGVAQSLGRLRLVDLATLTALWLVGLLIHTFALTAALPRLSHRRALTLNLTGSAVANVLPIGGAAGVALNHRMTRTWGYSNNAFAVFTVVTNVWDVLAKLWLPAAALGWLLLSGNTISSGLVHLTVVATGILLAVLLGGVAALASGRVTARLADALDRGTARLLAALRTRRTFHPGAQLVHLRTESATVIATGWRTMTVGILGYNAAVALLLWGCLHVAGAGLTPAQVFAGFALERVLTVVSITPGNAGVVEVGLGGLLLLLGGDPIGTVTGVLVYRALTFGLPIPVGGVGLAAWLWAHRGHAAAVVAPRPDATELEAAA